MKVSRGDVVVLDYLFSDGSGKKIRPALVLQSDEKNRPLTSTLVALITRNILPADTDPAQLLVTLASPEGGIESALNYAAVAIFRSSNGR